MTIIGGSGGYVPSHDRRLASVIPTVSGSAVALKNIAAASGEVVIGFRVVAGAGDSTVASERLSSVTSGAVQSGIDGAVTLSLSSAVVRLDVVGVATAVLGGAITPTGSATNALAHLTTFNFATPVSRIVVSCTPSWNSGREVQISVEAGV